MATTVEVPKLGNTVEDCLIAAWRKHKGDRVEAGDVIAEIETDKTNFDLTAPVGGTLLETFFEEGALVPVFTVICAIGSAGEDINALMPTAVGSPVGVAPPASDGRGSDETARGPEDGRPGPEEGTVPGEAGAPAGPARLSPRARRFAREHDFYPPSAQGRGPHGRVLEDDLRRALHAGPRPGPGPGPVPREPVAPGSAAGGTALGAGALGAALPATAGAPVSSVRQRIAKRLRESLTTTAQYTLNGSANAAGLLAVRKKMKASPATVDININDLVVFCTVRALLDAPGLNATFVDGALYRHPAVHIGFACDTDRGLVVPVVHDSQDLSLLGLARRLKELAAQAVEGTISVDDLNGGTFTVSNLGSLGVESFTPVLNPPQVAILGVNAIGLKPVRKPDGNIEFIDSIGLSLTLDHQVVDGAPGARFLRAVREKIEDAEALCTI
jgi:pyruvate dehydrogenase E2 component (dihydrolipoamide acetyltransferase)